MIHSNLKLPTLDGNILKGFRNQFNNGHVMYEGKLGTVCEDPIEKEFQRSLHKSYCIDDVSGKVLNSYRVRAARVDERDGVYNHNVFTKVPIQQCYYSHTGAAPISTKWVDVKKGDADDPDYRSLWVGRDFKGGR